MVQTASVFVLNKKAEPILVGKFRPGPDRILVEVIDQSYELALDRIVNRSQIDRKNGAIVQPEREPGVWLSMLPETYHGDYLWITVAEE